MNYIINDRNQSVIAVGAPGSVARARVQWPKLIERLNALYDNALDNRLPGRAVVKAVDMIRVAGVTSEMETSSILLASYYAEEPAGSPCALVVAVARPDDHMARYTASNATI
jgi:hypothetical protein